MLNKVSRGQNRLLGGWSTNRKLCGWLSQNHLHATPPSLGSMNAGRKSGCTSIRRPTGSPRLAHNSVRAASATSWRPTPPAPTGRPQKLLYSFFSSVASSDVDPACRNSNPDSGKTRCVACRYSQTPPLTFELPRGCVVWGLTTFFYGHRATSTRDTPPPTDVLVRHLPIQAITQTQPKSRLPAIYDIRL